MRPFHLGLAALVLAVGVAVLWMSIDAFPGLALAGGTERNGASADGSLAGVVGVGSGSSSNVAPQTEGKRVALASPDAAQNAPAVRKVRDKPKLSGRVVDPSGVGIPGARVFAASGESWIQIPLDVEPEGVPKGWIDVERTTTDAEGGFVFEDLEPGALRIAARAAGFAPRREDHLDLPDRSEHTLPDLRLERGVVLQGRVVDRQDKGIAGAVLLAALDAGAESSTSVVSIPGHGVPLATTQADGAFRIDQLAPGPWRLVVDAAGYAVFEEEGRTERAGETKSGLTFRLERGAEISGRIRAEDGPLPEGLRISARQSPEREGNGPSSSESEPPTAVDARARNVVCKSDGSFTVAGLKPDARYSLAVWKSADEPGGWKRLSAVQSVAAFAGQRGVELVYRAESALLLRAVDGRTGAPLTAFTVWAGVGQERPLRDEKNEVVHEFKDGRARYGELFPKRGGPAVKLRIAAQGFKDHENKSVGLAPGQELDLGELRLEPERIVVVKVVADRTGAIVAGARVLFGTKTEAELERYLDSPPDHDLWGESAVRYGRTGPDGKVRLSSMPGKSVVARARAKGFLTSDPVDVFLRDDHDEQVELRLRSGGTALVRVRDGTGKAVSGVAVVHRSPPKPGPRGALKTEEDHQKSDAEGTVRFEALAAGVHAFRAAEDESGDGWFGSEQEEDEAWIESVAAEGSHAELELLAPARGGLSGTVREIGRPLEGARLQLLKISGEGQDDEGWSGEPGSPYGTSTDHTGRYQFENLRCGQYTLLVSHPTRRMPARFPVTLENPPRSFDVELDVASIEGRVTGDDGSALSGIDVQAYGVQQDDYGGAWRMVVLEDDRGHPRVDWRQQASRTERSDANGRYLLRGVRTGEAITVSAHGDLVQGASSPEMTLGPDEAKRNVDFVLKYAGAIEIVLASDASNGRNWYEVKAFRMEEDGSEQMVHQNYVGSWNKLCRLGSLEPGKYKVTIGVGGNSQGSVLQSQEVEVVAGNTSKISFQGR